MKNLVQIKNAQPVTTSLQVAETFGKEHFNVMRDIQNLRKDILRSGINSNLESPNLDSVDKSTFPRDKYSGISSNLENSNLSSVDTSMFLEDSYQVEGNKRRYPMIYMNKDGWTLLVMGYQGEKATKFKLQYIAQFNQMEQELKQPKLSLPQNYASALRKLADTVEENEKLKAQLNQQDFQQGVLEQINTEVLYTTEEIANQFGYGGGHGVYLFYKKLHELGVVYPQRMSKGFKWHLYAKHQNKGYRGTGKTADKQKWTTAGKAFLESFANELGR
ncbi:Rha family transcriptional regulator [Enterococcus entomosocium]|uniref:Rha family transcriptional regulator n=1 Tax=Enterococcus entomosocium TaxID=3034352 RepID=UPI002649B6EB|nr:Rha family transcriptional regulator [Enterococcus entomosocium]